MFFDEIGDIKSIASKYGTSIFVLPDNAELFLPNAIILKPEEKSVISIEQIRNLLSTLSSKQVKERFIVIRPAELLSSDAGNAFLKSLEEPKDKVHFVLITSSLSNILPTIVSRCEIFILRQKPDYHNIDADNELKILAKKLITAKPTELISIADEISKKKDQTRAYAMKVVDVAIEMAYKSYILTLKPVFLAKLSKCLNLYDALKRNGHIKLQIVSNLC